MCPPLPCEIGKNFWGSCFNKGQCRHYVLFPNRRCDQPYEAFSYLALGPTVVEGSGKCTGQILLLGFW